MFTFNGYKHQGHSICSRKPTSKFVIGAFFRLVMFIKDIRFASRKPTSKFVIEHSLGTSYVVQRNKKKKFQILNNSKNTYLLKIQLYIDNRYINILFAVFGHFFFVYLNYFENCWEMFTFNGYKHQGHSICSRKPPSNFVIGAFFRLVMLYKETKKKKIQKSINNQTITYLFENSTDT
ncbi:hypothetical protein AGLY_016744 [Aphis glycines]|uniref:Uncharacterized protein n=1 Tax=Aphis glycines TaxID=307491 RepID=A0A6G0SXI0_APHGL|nr:hypothetical protein AGLY_016744 [Aphis glycines]